MPKKSKDAQDAEVMRKRHDEPPNYDSELERMVSALQEISTTFKVTLHELHLIRKSVQHIEEIFEKSPSQIGKAIFRADPPTPKNERP